MDLCQLAYYNLLFVAEDMMVRYLVKEKEAMVPLRINLPNNLNIAQDTKFFTQLTIPRVPMKLLPSDRYVK